jgi:signal transduction histidine kinase
MPTPAPDPPTRGPVIRWLKGLWRDMLLSSDPRKRRRLAAATLVLMAIIGVLDFLLGFEVSLRAFYFLPVVLGTAALGWRFGVVMSGIGVVTSVVGDLAAGAQYSNWVIPWWNALIALSTYLVIVWLFTTVRGLQLEMQERVRQRTAALTAEIAERERLEKILLDISERERANIGRELHDNLGQHLTGTAFAGQVLGEKLQALGLSEQADAWKIVALIEEGIEKTRHLAKGLLLEEIQRDGLVDALRELAAETSRQFHVACEFQLEGECHVAGSGVALHLLRIAQEAVRNGVRHGKAQPLGSRLAGRPDGLELRVQDDGPGLPPPGGRGAGLGLRIMAHRAQIIGGEFFIEAPPGGGTVVRCRLPGDFSRP